MLNLKFNVTVETEAVEQLLSHIVAEQIREVLPALLPTPSVQAQERLMTIPEVASWLHKSKPTIYKAIREGQLKAVRIPGCSGLRMKESELLNNLKIVKL